MAISKIILNGVTQMDLTQVLSRAATSTFAEHGAILFTSTCYPIKHECYTHGAAEE